MGRPQFVVSGSSVKARYRWSCFTVVAGVVVVTPVRVHSCEEGVIFKGLARVTQSWSLSA